MEKPKSFVYIIFCLTVCLAFAVGSNYLINTITQANMIYNRFSHEFKEAEGTNPILNGSTSGCLSDYASGL